MCAAALMQAEEGAGTGRDIAAKAATWHARFASGTARWVAQKQGGTREWPLAAASGQMRVLDWRRVTVCWVLGTRVAPGRCPRLAAVLAQLAARANRWQWRRTGRSTDISGPREAGWWRQAWGGLSSRFRWRTRQPTVSHLRLMAWLPAQPTSPPARLAPAQEGGILTHRRPPGRPSARRAWRPGSARPRGHGCRTGRAPAARPAAQSP